MSIIVRAPRFTGAVFVAAAVMLIPAYGRAQPTSALCTRQQRAILSTIDSLWEENAGLTAHDSIALHIANARIDADSLFLLNLLYREGRLLAAVNRSIEAESVLREGMLLASALGEPLVFRACLRWLGVALIGLGRLPEAKTSFEQLLHRSRASGDAYHEGYAWMGLAYDDWQNGRAAEAREKYLRSVSIFRTIGNRDGELWALIGLNNVLTMLGAYDEAMSGQRRIIAMGEESGRWNIEALGHNNLGALLFSIGDTGEALEHFLQAAEIQERNGNIRESIIAGQNICICEMILGRTRIASEQLSDLLRRCRENGYIDIEAGVLKELAYVHLQQGDHRAAARLFRDALSLGAGLTSQRECDAIIGLSGALARMDSTGAALRLLRDNADRMLKLEDARIQLAFRTELAQRLLDEGFERDAYETATIAEKRGAERGLTALRLQALPIAARAAIALGEPDSAFVLLRRGIRLWEADRVVPLDPQWREQRSASAKRIFSQLGGLLLQDPADSPRAIRVREAFDILQAYKARTLLERMSGPGRHEIAGRRASPITLDALRAKVLQRGELLLDFTVGEKQSILFACTSDTVRAATLPGESDLSRKVLLFHGLLSSPPSAKPSPVESRSLISAARSISRVLFSSCADLIAESRHVVVVPDGALNLVPFSYLLSVEGTQPAGEKTDPSLEAAATEGRTVSRIPAAAILASLRENANLAGPASGRSGRILALAGRSTEGGEALRGTNEEISRISRRYDGVTTRLRPDSILSADVFARFEILHFAAHSTVDDQSPWRSAIHLDAARDRKETFPLRASQIAGWNLPARLAVLSSCESAGGRILSGEGVLGLTSAFLSAGVPAVLATLWPVDDEAAVEFVGAFYDALDDGETASSAVQSAQRMVRRRSRNLHPFYWAGFDIIGDGEMRIELREKPVLRRFWWATALLAVLIWILVAIIRKKI